MDLNTPSNETSTGDNTVTRTSSGAAPAVEQFEAVVAKHLLAYTDESRYESTWGRAALPTGTSSHSAALHSHTQTRKCTRIAGAAATAFAGVVAFASQYVETGDDSSNPWLTVLMVALIAAVTLGIGTFVGWTVLTGGPSIGRDVPAPVAAARRDLLSAVPRLRAVEAPVEAIVKVQALVEHSDQPLMLLIDAYEENEMHTPRAVEAAEELFATAAEVNALIEVATVRHKTIQVAHDAGFPRERLLTDGAEMIDNTTMLRELLGNPTSPSPQPADD